MLFEKEIAFSFKGNRDYVHGTDIFDKILDTVRVFFKEYPNKMKGSFHRLLARNAILRIYDDAEEIHSENLNALFSFQLKNNSYQACISEVNSQITSSYEYDEKRVLDKVIIERKTAQMVAKSSYTYIEQMVAMTKKLHLTLYPDVAKKWLFTRIEIQDVLDPSRYSGHELAIKALGNFHNRLTQNAISLDGNMLGHIWFSKAL